MVFKLREKEMISKNKKQRVNKKAKKKVKKKQNKKKYTAMPGLEPSSKRLKVGNSYE